MVASTYNKIATIAKRFLIMRQLLIDIIDLLLLASGIIFFVLVFIEPFRKKKDPYEKYY